MSAAASAAESAASLNEVARHSGETEKTVAPATGHLAVALQVGAALLWLPQAGLIATAIGGVAAGALARDALFPAFGILVLGIGRALLERAGTRLAFDDARAQLSALRERAVRSLAGQSPIDVSRSPSGQVASALAEQAEAIVPWLARYRPLRLKAAAVPLVILACVLYFSWAAALVLLVAAPLIPIFMALIGWRAKEASERQLVRMGDMNAFLLDRLRGLTTIRAFRASNRTALQLRADAQDLRLSTMAVLRIAFLSSAVLELFAALGVALVAVYVGFHYLGELNFGAWGGKLDLTQGLFILLLAPAFFEPLRDLSSVWHDRASGEAGLDALERVAQIRVPLVGTAEALTTTQFQEEGALSVSIEGLTFFHVGQDHPVFDSFDLAIDPGEHIAVMAPSGGGKSTLLSVISGLAPASSGVVRIGGQPLNDATAACIRTRIAWLGQPPHIFPGTLAGNVSLGRPEIDREVVRRAMVAARVDDLADSRGATVVGENGIGLSGGEALRLALARAAAGEGRGLILADEPTAHLDAETAAEVTESLLSISRGKTLVVVTHDPVLAARMDRIVTLQSSCHHGSQQ